MSTYNQKSPVLYIQLSLNENFPLRYIPINSTNNISTISYLHRHSQQVKKIKAIYHTMNMFNLDVTQKCLIAECWLPEADIEVANQALRRGTERSGNSVPSILNRVRTKATPPTYNKTNVLTGGFQVRGERVLPDALLTLSLFGGNLAFSKRDDRFTRADKCAFFRILYII